MNSYEIASPTHHLVLEKQRRESEIASSPLHQPRQVRHARLDLEEINTRFSADDFAWEREVPTWHWHGKK